MRSAEWRALQRLWLAGALGHRRMRDAPAPDVLPLEATASPLRLEPKLARGRRGVLATGVSLEGCRDQLAEVVEEWVLGRVARGLSVPPLGKAVVRVKQAS